ncbi:hypothetical protein HMPREF3198_00506 [Winkia neuii]|nr:hypothetical protein HMPREF3198_00506 [Winkia neuii]
MGDSVAKNSILAISCKFRNLCKSASPYFRKKIGNFLDKKRSVR